MGGARETTVQTPAKATKTASIDLISGAQKVRIHEKDGKVHFHADEEKLKAAVPVAEWYEAWKTLVRPPQPDMLNSWTYTDVENGTLLSVSTSFRTGPLEAEVIVSKMDFGPTFTELDKFTAG